MVSMPGVLAGFDYFPLLGQLSKMFGDTYQGDTGKRPQLFISRASIVPDELDNPVFGIGGVHNWYVW